MQLIINKFDNRKHIIISNPEVVSWWEEKQSNKKF